MGFGPFVQKFPQISNFETNFHFHILLTYSHTSPLRPPPVRTLPWRVFSSLPQWFFARVYSPFLPLLFTVIDFMYPLVVLLCLIRRNGGLGVLTRTTSRASANSWRNFSPSSYSKSRHPPFCFRSSGPIKPTSSDDDPTYKTKDENTLRKPYHTGGGGVVPFDLVSFGRF